MGKGAASDFKTIIVPITAVHLAEGEFIRVITSCPYPDEGAEQGTAVISTATNTPFSKSLNIRLIDYNL